MIRLLVAIGSLVVSLSAAAVDLPIHWIRVNDIPQWEVRDGVCVVYMPVTSHKYDDDDIAMEPLVRHCIAHGHLTGRGDFTLSWNVVDDEQQVQDEERQYGPPLPMLSISSHPDHFDYGAGVLGFFRREGSVCYVTTAKTATVLGHELRHCYDGLWH